MISRRRIVLSIAVVALLVVIPQVSLFPIIPSSSPATGDDGRKRRASNGLEEFYYHFSQQHPLSPDDSAFSRSRSHCAQLSGGGGDLPVFFYPLMDTPNEIDEQHNTVCISAATVALGLEGDGDETEKTANTAWNESKASQHENQQRDRRKNCIAASATSPPFTPAVVECDEAAFAEDKTNNVGLGVVGSGDEQGEWIYSDGAHGAPTAWRTGRPVPQRWGASFRELLDASSTPGSTIRILIIGDSLIRVFLPVFASLLIEEIRAASSLVAPSSVSMRRLVQFVEAASADSLEAHDLETQDISMQWPKSHEAFNVSPVQILFLRAFLIDESFPLAGVGRRGNGFVPTHVITNRAHDYGVVKGWHDANVPIARIPSTLMRLRAAFPTSLVFFYGVIAAHKPLKKASKYQVCERRHHIEPFRMAERYAVALANTAVLQKRRNASNICVGTGSLFFYISLNAMSASIRNHRLCSRHGDGWHYQGKAIREMAKVVLRHLTQATTWRQQEMTSAKVPRPPSTDEEGSMLERTNGTKGSGEEMRKRPPPRSLVTRVDVGRGYALHIPILSSWRHGHDRGDTKMINEAEEHAVCSLASRRTFFSTLVKCKPTSIDLRATELSVQAAAKAHAMILANLINRPSHERGRGGEGGGSTSDVPLARRIERLVGIGGGGGGGSTDEGGVFSPSSSVLTAMPRMLKDMPAWMAFPPLSIVTKPFADAFAAFTDHPNQFPSPATCGAVLSLFRDVVGDLAEWLHTQVRHDLWTGKEEEPTRPKGIDDDPTTVEAMNVSSTLLRSTHKQRKTIRRKSKDKMSVAVQSLQRCIRFVIFDTLEDEDKKQWGVPNTRSGGREDDAHKKRLFSTVVASMRLEHSFSCKKDIASWLLHAPHPEALISAVPETLLRAAPEEPAVERLGCDEQDSFDDKMIRRDLYWPMMIDTSRLHDALLQSRATTASSLFLSLSSSSTSALSKLIASAANSCLEYIAHVARPGSDFSLSLRQFVLVKCGETMEVLERLRDELISIYDKKNMNPKMKKMDRHEDRGLGGSGSPSLDRLLKAPLHFPGWGSATAKDRGSAEESPWSILQVGEKSTGGGGGGVWMSKEGLRSFMWNTTGRPAP